MKWDDDIAKRLSVLYIMCAVSNTANILLGCRLSEIKKKRDSQVVETLFFLEITVTSWLPENVSEIVSSKYNVLETDSLKIYTSQTISEVQQVMSCDEIPFTRRRLCEVGL